MRILSCFQVCYKFRILLNLHFVPKQWLPALPSRVWTSSHLFACLNLLERLSKSKYSWVVGDNKIAKCNYWCIFMLIYTYSAFLLYLDHCRFQEFHHLGLSCSPCHSSVPSVPAGPLVSLPVNGAVTHQLINDTLSCLTTSLPQTMHKSMTHLLYHFFTLVHQFPQANL